MAEKIRLDVYMNESGMCESREKARALIMEGKVFLDNQKCDKPGMQINPEKDKPEIRGEVLRYVSRGGLKLEKAMKEFPISLEGKITMDIGASTGGFTDCMLQNGAVKVYSIDVGYGQLAWKLRQDERVVNLERTNIRYVTEEQVPDKVDFASIDVSFISLKLVLPVAYNLLSEKGEVAALIKPQFEAGREQVGKKGVVKDINVHFQVCKNALGYARETGFYPCGIAFSPIKGPEGNIEYLMYLKKESSDIEISDEEIWDVINKSHETL